MTAKVVETHCSTLVFVEDLVYKGKKPVDLGFLDFTTPDSRRAACEAEVALNRRFAPDVYLGVAQLTGPGTPWGEPLVVMRRLPDERRLSHVLTSDEDVRPALLQLARELAAVHRRSPAPEHLREPGRLAELWSEGLAQLTAHEGLVPREVRERTETLAMRYLAGRGSLLERRVWDGRAVDGHGDLLADDVFLTPEGPKALDCLEFDERLRVGDGLLDAAFLAMDLEHLGRPDLARVFLDSYRAAAGEDAPPSLEHHFQAYRAHIRSKVACVRAAQTGDTSHGSRARALADLALAHLEAGRIRLVLVGGPPGSGKSTVSAGLADALDARTLSSDVLRKSIHGLSPTSSAAAPPGTGLYAAGVTSHTYSALGERARQLLRCGRSVVVDATFSDRRHRAAMRALARETCADLTELRCVVDEGVAQVRLATRPPGHSDADPGVRSWLLARTDPWPEAHPVDTRGEARTSVALALATVLGPTAAGTPALG